MLERLLPARLGRSFRWLFAASTSSNLGDGVLLAAGPLLVASLTRDPLAISLAVFAQQLPWLLFGLLAGTVVDRVDRRALVMVADAFRAVVLVALVLLVLTGVATPMVLYAIFFGIGTAETFADNAASTLTVSVVPKADLGIANARVLGSAMVANQMVGPPLGAALFTLAAWGAFGVAAVLTAVGAVLVSRMAVPAPQRAAPSVSVWQQTRAGARWLRHHPPVRTLAVMITVFNVTFGAVFGVYVLYAQDRLGVGDLGFGLLLSVLAVGGVLGSALYARLEARLSYAALLRTGLVVETSTHAILALTQSYALACVVFFAFGVHAAVWGTTSVTVRQRAVPEELLGRVTSVYLLGEVGGLAVGTVIGGWIAAQLGLLAAFWFAFAGSLVALALLWRPMRAVAHAAEDS